jgi:hypothetical protein
LNLSTLKAEDAGARNGIPVAVEIDEADCARAAAANPLRSLAARALAARRDDDIELRREAMQPPVKLLLLVLLDADCAATERIESKKERES